MTERPETAVTSAHHALLFAEIAKAVLETAGADTGEAAVRKCVRRYGEERGRRMALRAQADGAPPNLTSYLQYGEWEVPHEDMEESATETDRDVIAKVFKCPWHTTWEDAGMLRFGKLYCLEIDEALVRGFNPECRIHIAATRTNTGEPCEFRFRDARLPNAAKGRKMPWDYHSGHLLKSMKETIEASLGDAGRDAVETALSAFRRRVGAGVADRIIACSDADFSRLPD